MKISIRSRCLRPMLVALSCSILASCDLTKSDEAVVLDAVPSDVSTVSEDRPTGMSLEEFNRRFLGIISDGRQMESEIALKLDKLCEHLDSDILDGMLAHAAQPRISSISDDAWLLGYNQLMAMAGCFMGQQASAALYKLAADERAPATMRDYASQHYIRTETRVLHTLDSNASAEERLNRLQQVIDKSALLVGDASEDAGTIPGSTLLGLAALSMEFPHDSEEFEMIHKQVAVLTLPLLQQPRQCSDPMLIAAMQSAARLHVEQAGALILAIATDVNAHVSARMSAIASLEYYPDLVKETDLETVGRGHQKLEFSVKSLAARMSRNSQ